MSDLVQHIDTGEVMPFRPSSALDVADRCSSIEEQAAQCDSIAEVKHQTDLVAAMGEYLSRNSVEGRARLEATRRRLECRIGVLLGEGKRGNPTGANGHGGIYSASEIPADADKLHPNERTWFRKMAANLHIVEQVIADSGDRRPASRRKVLAAISEAAVDEPDTVSDVRRHRPAWERAAQIAALAGQGYRASQIAAHLGVGEPQIRKLARDHDITLPDAAMGPSRAIDPHHVVEQTVLGLANEATALGMVDLGHPRDFVSPDEAAEWAASLTQSLRSLTTLRNQLKEAARATA